MSRPRLSGFVVGAALLVLASLAGCGDDGSAGDTTAPSGTVGTVTVYFAAADGSLVAETRPVPAGDTPLDAALDGLAAGPSDPDLMPALPPGTRALGAGVADDVATVDMSAELEARYPFGSSAAELALLGTLVRTAAEASGASRVRILVAGQPLDPASTQFDLSQPLSPEDVAAAG